MRKRKLAALCLLAISPIAHSEDWESCSDDLDALRRATRDAADAANEVKEKAEQLEECKRDPETYSLLGDMCRSQANEYDDALSDLESELDTVASRIRSVNSSCGVDLPSVNRPSLAKPKVPSSGNETCDLYRRYKGRLPIEILLKHCIKSMSEADCRKCLIP